MSEYQYYEFQAIDRSLTEEEQQAVAQLSSRLEPHPWRAVFVYNYGNFNGDPEKILARYYDAMLYITHWGSRRLAFRFPSSILNLEEVQAYCQPPIVEDYISCSTVGEYAILNVEFHNETGGGWVEGEGWLPAMIGLRDDILRGDYRALYLAWLKTPEVEALRDSVVEPPVPPGLSRLSPSLRSFVEFFGINECLVQVAAEASSSRKTVSDEWLHGAIARLPREECDVFLLRLARGEPHLAVELNRRLGKIASATEPESVPRRTVGQLLKKTQERWEDEQRQQAEKAEAKRIWELEAWAQKQAQTWREIEILIHRSQGKAYQEAAELLVKLREVAVYQSQEVAFQERLNRIYEQYKNRHSLLSRLREAGLHQQ